MSTLPNTTQNTTQAPNVIPWPTKAQQFDFDQALARFKSDDLFNRMVLKCIESVRIALHAAEVTTIDPVHMLDTVVLSNAWDGIFSTGANRPYQLLNPVGQLVEASPAKVPRQIRETFGSVIREGVVKELGPGFAKENAAEIEQEVRKAVTGSLLDMVDLYRQRSAVEYLVDMFGSGSRIEFTDQHARVVYAHIPFNEHHGVDDETVDRVVADFIHHCPFWWTLLDTIAAARFAADRRDAYAWIHAPSDWGKGMLTAALADLGIVTEMSVKEIEAAIEGKAVGASPADFVRAWVVLVDEWKTVKAELKQLNNTLHLSPKFQLRSRVPLFTKLFTSAEDVAALTGSEGVEEQFSNRFSYLSPGAGAGRLDDRPVFMEVGKAVYRKALTTVIARHFNEYVVEMRRIGSDAASKQSDDVLFQFNCDHRLTNYFDSLESSVEDHATDLKQLLREYGEWRLTGGQFAGGWQSTLTPMPGSLRNLPVPMQQKLEANSLIVQMREGTVLLLKRPSSFIGDWLNTRVDRGQIRKLMHKINPLMELVNECGTVTSAKRYTEVQPGYKVTKSSVGKGIAIILREESSKSDDVVSFL